MYSGLLLLKSRKRASLDLRSVRRLYAPTIYMSGGESKCHADVDQHVAPHVATDVDGLVQQMAVYRFPNYRFILDNRVG